MKRDQTIKAAHYAKGADYEPFLQTHHVPSLGIASRILGMTSGRIHHLLSKLELQFFYLLDWSEEISEIREQFPLPLAQTQTIADELGFTHPRQIPTSTPMVMTTDFLVNHTTNGEFAICVKPSQELEKPRIIQKIEIERRYWETQNTQFKVATEKEVPQALVQNIEWIHDALENPHGSDVTDSAEGILRRLLNEGKTLVQSASETDRALNLSPGDALSLTRHFLATRRWTTDLTEKINPAHPLVIGNG